MSFFIKIHLILDSCVQHLGQQYVQFISTFRDGQLPPSKGNLFSVCPPNVH